jgi:hypothetical protein
MRFFLSVFIPRRDPPSLIAYEPGETRLLAVAQQLQVRDEFLVEIRECLEQAQQYHRSQYDRRHREVDFLVGDLVWLRQLHHPLASMDNKGRNKLGPCFYGPFKVLEKIGELAYRIELPAGAQLHNVFHVGLFKPFKGTTSGHTTAAASNQPWPCVR